VKDIADTRRPERKGLIREGDGRGRVVSYFAKRRVQPMERNPKNNLIRERKGAAENLYKVG